MTKLKKTQEAIMDLIKNELEDEIPVYDDDFSEFFTEGPRGLWSYIETPPTAEEFFPYATRSALCLITEHVWSGKAVIKIGVAAFGSEGEFVKSLLAQYDIQKRLDEEHEDQVRQRTGWIEEEAPEALEYANKNGGTYPEDAVVGCGVVTTEHDFPLILRDQAKKLGITLSKKAEKALKLGDAWWNKGKQ